ncbi:MAG: hypothetical protein R3D57_18350 [Hyphomicrobiaceae bacterium]
MAITYLSLSVIKDYRLHRLTEDGLDKPMTASLSADYWVYGHTEP